MWRLVRYNACSDLPTKSIVIESPPAQSGAPVEVLSRSSPEGANSRYIWVFLGCAIALYFLFAIHASSRRLWHDELYTLYIATSPTLADLWKNIRLDLNPPLSYLAVRLFVQWFGSNEIVVRLPSIIAFLGGSLCFFAYLSKVLNCAYALLGLLVLWANPFAIYATEARPYGLIIGFFGLALLAWQRSQGENRSPLSPLLLGFAVVGMMMSHFFAVFYLVPFFAAEFVQWFQTRRRNWAVWAALVLPCPLPFLYLSTINAYRSNDVFPAEFRASLRRVFHFFNETLQPECMVLLVIVVLAMAFVPRNSLRPASNLFRQKTIDTVFWIVLLALPIYLNVVLMRSHSAFHSRYAIPTIFVYALVIGLFLARYAAGSRMVAGVASVILCLYIVTSNFEDDVRALLRGHRPPPASPSRFDPFEKVQSDLPLVAASGLTFLEMDHYATSATKSRLYYLTDRELAIRIANATIFEGFGNLKGRFPIKANVEPYRDFVAQHSRFLVLGTPWYSEDWLLPYLLEIHAKLVYLGSYPGIYKDWQLYDVTMPGSESNAAKAD